MAAALQDFVLSFLASIHLTKTHTELQMSGAYLLNEKGRILYVAVIKPPTDDGQIMLKSFLFQTDPNTKLSTNIAKIKLNQLKALMKNDGVPKSIIDAFGSEVNLIQVKQVTHQETGYWSDANSPLTVLTNSGKLTPVDGKNFDPHERFRRLVFQQADQAISDTEIVIPRDTKMPVIDGNDFLSDRSLKLVNYFSTFVKLNAAKQNLELTKASLDRMLAGFSLGIEKNVSGADCDSFGTIFHAFDLWYSNAKPGAFFSQDTAVVVDIREPESTPRSPILPGFPFEIETESRAYAYVKVDKSANNGDVKYAIHPKNTVENTHLPINSFIAPETPYGQQLDALKHCLRYSMQVYDQGVSRHVILGELLKKDYDEERAEGLYVFQYADEAVKRELTTFVVVSDKRATVINVADTDYIQKTSFSLLQWREISHRFLSPITRFKLFLFSHNN